MNGATVSNEFLFLIEHCNEKSKRPKIFFSVRKSKVCSAKIHERNRLKMFLKGY